MDTCTRCSAALSPDDTACPICGVLVDDDSLWAKPPDEEGNPWVSPAQAPSPGLDATTTWNAPDDPTGPFRTSPPSVSLGSPPPAATYGAPPGYQSPFGAPAPGYAPPHGTPYGPATGGIPPYGGPAWHGPPPGYGYGPPMGVYVPPTYRTPHEGLAIASFVTSLAGLVLAGSCLFPVVACPVGAVMGHMAMRRIDASGKQGRGLALAGAIIGWIGTAFLVAGILFFTVLAVTGQL